MKKVLRDLTADGEMRQMKAKLLVLEGFLKHLQRDVEQEKIIMIDPLLVVIDIINYNIYEIKNKDKIVEEESKLRKSINETIE